MPSNTTQHEGPTAHARSYSLRQSVTFVVGNPHHLATFVILVKLQIMVIEVEH
jgi:hypothetical protein